MDARSAHDYVYLDYAATAPLCEEALEAMAPYMVVGAPSVMTDGNANSLHTPGRLAFERLEKARKRFAAAVGASRPAEIVFTGGATEADNAALVGLAHAAVRKRAQEGRACRNPRIVVSSIEHDAILRCADSLARDGFRISFAACDRGGFVTAESLGRAMDEDTVLVSIQAANAEIGAVQPIADLAHAAHDAGAVFHTDAAQALGKVPFDAGALGVDAATFAAHKVGGPKGVGALYLRARSAFEPFLVGGGQESGRRSGTQNVCGIVGFTAACEAAVAARSAETVRLRAMRDRLYAALCAMPRVEATVCVEPGDERYLPNIVHVLVRDMESETLVLKLDQLGFGVSGGSACASHSLEPSHVVSALGISADRAFGALRISFGRFTSEADLDKFAEALESCIR